MATTQYKMHRFSSSNAQEGALVAMVLTSIKDGDVVSTATWTGEDPNPLKGVGICGYGSNVFRLTLNGITYSFDTLGGGVSDNALGYKIMLAETSDKPATAGNVVETTSTTTVTRGATGEIIGTKDVPGDSSVMISNMEVRDQFAIYILKTLMEKTERNISAMTENEKMYYCDVAYQWAASMMTQASKARANVETEGSSGGGTASDGTTRGISVDSSEVTSTTDKLLNNIISALERTDEKRKSGNEDVFYERVILPDLKTQIDEYVSHTETPEEGDPVTTKYGLYDLIKAIENSGGGQTEIDFTDLIAAINATHTNNIGNAGLGRDAEHPIYMTGGGFPSRSVLAAAFAEAAIHDFLTFNAAGAVGYSTKEEVKKAILGWLNAYADLTALYTALQSSIDSRIKSWLNATTIVSDGEGGWKLNVPNNI